MDVAYYVLAALAGMLAGLKSPLVAGAATLAVGVASAAQGRPTASVAMVASGVLMGCAARLHWSAPRTVVIGASVGWLGVLLGGASELAMQLARVAEPLSLQLSVVDPAWIQAWVSRLSPALGASWALAQCALTYWLCSRVARPLRLRMPVAPPEWRLPGWMKWSFAASLALAGIGPHLDAGPAAATALGANAILVHAFVFLASGAGLAYRRLRGLGVPPLPRVVLVTAGVVSPLALALVAWGCVSLWMAGAQGRRAAE